MPDSITQELSSAYAQLAELQTKLDEDDYIISMLQSSCGGGDGYDLALVKVSARRKELDGDLKKVKKKIREIEEKGVRWRG